LVYVTALPQKSQAVIYISFSGQRRISEAYKSTTSFVSRFENNGTDDSELFMPLFKLRESNVCFVDLQSEAEKKIVTEEELERKKKKDEKV